MLRFNRAFHQSDVATFKHCPRMFYYRNVLELAPERISEAALAGSALHAALAKAHTDQVWDPDALFAFWQEEIATIAGLDRNQITDIAEIFYVVQQYNVHISNPFT